ncbi:MAG TPA: hypothetical protein VG499_11515, partial [Actinomycetota bacterium]|nr:hypothetical protein [Actinomycetota bacterium]
ACYQGDPGTGRFRLGAVNVVGLRAGRVVELAGSGRRTHHAQARCQQHHVPGRLLRRTPPRRRHPAGRARSYLGFKGFWPPQADNPDARPVIREIGRRNNAIDKVVVSDTLTEDQTDPWRSTTTIVRRADAHTRIAELKRQEGREILVFGSRTT